ncbi:MAG: hypothetical protein ACYDD4_11375 [Acidimicrobiales bacterium]
MVDTMALVIDNVSEDVLLPGTKVDVRSRFVGAWSHGFEIAERIEGEGYRVRRLSDGWTMPDIFTDDDVRPVRRRNDFWWY